MGEIEFVKWLIDQYGPAAIPSLVALFLAWRVARDSKGDLHEDYHAAIVEMTKAMQEMKTLLDERTRRQSRQRARQDDHETKKDAPASGRESA